MRLRSLLLFSIVFALLSITAGVSAQGSTLPREDIQRIAQSVVNIIALDANLEPFSTGSGTIVTPDGVIYTNRHVIDDGADFAIFTLGDDMGELPELSYFASLVSVFDQLDFAVLQIDRDSEGRRIDASSLNLPFITPSVEEVGIGDQVTIFGYPQIADGYMLVTTGTIAGVQNGTIGGERIPVWYQTAAEISPGNSGGLAVNGDGELIGLPTAVVSEDRTGGRIGGILPIIAVNALVNAGGGSGVDSGSAPGESPPPDSAPNGDSSPQGDTVVFTIANQTGSTICNVYISPTTSSSWGQSRLQPGDSIEPGQIYEWTANPNTYDIKLEDCDGNTLSDTREIDIFQPIDLVFSGIGDTLAFGSSDPGPAPTTPPANPPVAAGNVGVPVTCDDVEFTNGVEVVVVQMRAGFTYRATAIGINGFDPVLAVLDTNTGTGRCNDDSTEAARYTADLPTTGVVGSSSLNSQVTFTQDTGNTFGDVSLVVGGYNSQPGEFLLVLEGMAATSADNAGDPFSVRLTEGMVASGTDLSVYMIAATNSLDPYLFLSDPGNPGQPFTLDTGEEVYCDDAGSSSLCWNTGLDLSASSIFTQANNNLPGGSLDSMLTIPLEGLQVTNDDPQYFSFYMTSFNQSSQGEYVIVFHMGTQ